MSIIHPLISYVKKLIGAITHHSFKLIAQIYYTLVRVKDKLILTDTWRGIFYYPIAQLNSIVDQIKKYLKKTVADLVNIQQVILLLLQQTIRDIIQLSDKWKGIFHKIIMQSNSVIDLIKKCLKKTLQDLVSVNDKLTSFFVKYMSDEIILLDSLKSIYSKLIVQSNSINDFITKKLISFRYDIIQISEKITGFFINIPKDYLSLKDIYTVNYSRGIREGNQLNDYLRKKTSTALTFPFTFPAVFGVGWGEWEEL